MILKKKGISLVLSSMIIASNINLAPIYANEKPEVIESGLENFVETENGFKFNYKQFEDGRDVYYYEEFINDTVYTKKYIKSENKLILIGELTTSFTAEGSNYIIKIHDITNNKTTIDIMKTETEITSRAIKPGKAHPKDKTYMLNYGTTGHQGIKNMTKAAITGLVTTIISGGRITAGVAATVAAAFMDGGWSNLYYSSETYIPNRAYGSIKGKPIWKTVTKFYSDSKRTRKVGDTMYTQATLYAK